MTYTWELNCTVHGRLNGFSQSALQTSSDVAPSFVCPINAADALVANSMRQIASDTQVVNNRIVSGTVQFNATTGTVILPMASTDPSSPSAGQLYLNTVSNLPMIWDGAKWQPIKLAGGDDLFFSFPGTITVSSLLGTPFVANGNYTIQAVRAYRVTAGLAGSTVIDIIKNGTTLYTTPANRPTFNATDGNNKSIVATLPDVKSISAGDVITISTTSVETGTPANLSVCLFVA